MDSIESHIRQNEDILSDPTISAQYRRHVEAELDELKQYAERHPDEHKDPSSLEVYCDLNPDALECRIYED